MIRIKVSTSAPVLYGRQEHVRCRATLAEPPGIPPFFGDRSRYQIEITSFLNNDSVGYNFVCNDDE